MKIIKLSIDKLTPDPNNAKEHPDWQIEQIKNSIEQFGNNDPIAVWGEKNIIVEGHGRYEALKELGYTEAECIRLDSLTDEERKAYALAHNKLTMNTDFDLETLNLSLDEIENIDMSLFSFDIKEELRLPEVEEEQEESETVEARCKSGEIWRLGKHRLMCGSSTEEKDAARLMNGNQAQMLFTSPPYSDMRDYRGGKDLSVQNIAQFIKEYRPYVDYQCVNLGIQRKNGEIYQYWDEYIDIARQAGYKMLAWNVWDKGAAGSIGQQRAFFPIRHEWIFVFGTEFFEINQTVEKKNNRTKGRKVRQKDGSMRESSIGDISHNLKQAESVLQLSSERGAIRKQHPATFPIDLPAEYIKSMTQKGDNVIEPFGGSGTTIIACEGLDRNCYAMELDPRYCDVIIQRWEDFTGQKAVLLSE